MSNFNISITDEQVFLALWDWLTAILPGDVSVVRGDENRVSNPQIPFIMMHRISAMRLTTNETGYTDDVDTDEHIETTEDQVDFSMQLDVCGKSAGDQARLIALLFRSDYACRFFEPYSIQPLYLDDPKHMPVVNGEEQYEQRWMTTLHLQFNPSVNVPAEFMDSASVVLVDVDATIPT
jgi:hypothetical protein